ncbi:MAG: NAD(P)-dependent oxidoreductase [Candidatus Fermentibacteraceae bacterium]
MAEILVTGGNGLLGTAVLARLGCRATGMDLPGLDITDWASVTKGLKMSEPSVIINCAALTDVDKCQTNPDRAFLVHRDGVRHLAATGARLVTISTDHVFTTGDAPITEGAPTHPANLYGESKLSGELEALATGRSAVIRTSWLFGKGKGLLPWLHSGLIRGAALNVVKDQTACVTFVPHLVEAIVRIVDSGSTGIFHCVNPGPVTPLGLASTLRERLGCGTVRAVCWKDLDVPAPRPVYSALGTTGPFHLPPLDAAFEEWMESL